MHGEAESVSGILGEQYNQCTCFLIEQPYRQLLFLGGWSAYFSYGALASAYEAVDGWHQRFL
jgi:hypothetical protein